MWGQKEPFHAAHGCKRRSFCSGQMAVGQQEPLKPPGSRPRSAAIAAGLTASKSAVVALAETLAAELTGTAIAVSVLCLDRYELTINIKSANTTGLALPPSILARADEVMPSRTVGPHSGRMNLRPSPAATARSDPPRRRNLSLSRHCPGVTGRAVLHPHPCTATSPQAHRYFRPAPRAVTPLRKAFDRVDQEIKHCCWELHLAA
jgi:hypothetical protein